MAKSGNKVAVRVNQEDGEIVLHGRAANGGNRHYTVTDHIVEVDEEDLQLVLAGVPDAHRARVASAAREETGASKPDAPESKDGHGSNPPNRAS